MDSSGWRTVTIGDICAVLAGRSFKSREFAPAGIRLLRGTNIVPGGTRWRDIKMFPEHRVPEFSDYLLRAGDIVIAMDRPIISTGLKVARLCADDVPALLVQRVGRLRVRDDIDPDYVYYFLRSRWFRSQCAQLATGTQLPHLSVRDIRAAAIPLAPAAEQPRIVARLRAALARTERARQQLAIADDLCRSLQQSILAAAFTGRLSSKWRSGWRAGQPGHGSAVDSAIGLMQRIESERRERWERATLARMRARGRAPRGDIWRAKYRPADAPEVGDAPELPAGWRWTTLGALTWHSGYGSSKKCAHDAPGEPVLRIANITDTGTDAGISLDELKRACEPLMLPADRYLRPGDFLVVRTNGSRDLLGRAALVRAEHVPTATYYASYLIRFRLCCPPVVQHWLERVWRAPFVRAWIAARAGSSAGQYNISMSRLVHCPIPLPPEAEAEWLTDRMAALLARWGRLSKGVRGAQEWLDGVEAAVLGQAFGGRCPADRGQGAKNGAHRDTRSPGM